MVPDVATLLLWLFVINLGTAFGAGVYEARVVVPAWKDLPRQSWPNTGVEFWAYVTTVPLTLLMLANAVAAWLDDGPARPWWLAAAAIAFVERIATFTYFIPTMLRLAGSPGLSDGEVRDGLSRWLAVNHGRNLLVLASWMAVLVALTRAA